ncbi:MULTISPECIES: YceI family protein [unclassified Saccharicrinis]|uniref:YceI family protein n=1 Tax=unclassified Saccharicrinis TaxID=2646859 RepID=UPI003D339BB5
MKAMKLLFAVTALLVASSTFAQTYQVDASRTSIKWEGKKIGGTHNGDIKLKEGSFTVQGNQITAGTFLIDMSTITNADIESDEYRKKLIGHLKSDDFFGVEKFPTAQLKITGSTTFKNNVAKVTGDLTIKENTHPIEFEVTKSGNKYTTTLIVDRAKYDVRYGSKSFFDNLGDKVIYDDFTLDVNLTVR